jgi:hypothetical protein
VRRGREAENQQPGVRIAEARHRPRPVGLVTKRAAFLAANLPTVFAQARTTLAPDDLVVDNGKRDDQET